MNNPAANTPLESLLLFQSVLSQGIDSAAFARISEQLRNNGLVKADRLYDPLRLSPDALQQSFFRLFQEELRGETLPAASIGDGSTSPTSKKRKIAGPPLPTLKDVHENIEKIPALMDRLYARYRDNLVKQIREDESRFDTVQKEIHLIEKSENQRLARLASQNGAAVTAPRDIKPGMTPTRPGATAVTTSAPTTAPSAKRPTSTTPIIPPKPPTPTIAPPSHLAQGANPMRPTPNSSQPGTAPNSVLQAPAGLAQQQARVLQPPVQTPKVPISPRPEASNQAKNAPTTPQPPATPGQGTLKWEKPYQPPQAAQTPPPRQNISPAPPKATLAPQPQQPQQPQAPQAQQPPAPQVPQHGQAQQQWQQQHQNQHQTQTPVPVPAPSGPTPTNQTKPVLVAPQNAGQVVPQIQPGPPRPTGTTPTPQARQPAKTPVPPPQHRPIQPQQAPAPQQQPPRPIAASPTPPPAVPALSTTTPQRWPQGHNTPQGQQVLRSISPAPTMTQKDKPFAASYPAQPPRPAIPEHMIRQAAAGTPLASRKTNAIPSAPSTPVQSTPATLLRGFGTKWAAQSTPSTPGAFNGEPQSPAFEPVSPPQRPVSLARPAPKTAPKKQASKAAPAVETLAPKPTRGRQSRQSQKRGTSATPSTTATRRSQSVISHTDEVSTDQGDTTAAPKIKNEESTPRPQEETGDTTADESVTGRGLLATPKDSLSKALKRKRQDTPTDDLSTLPPQVLWTRGFTKVSSSALDQISSHRDANMFATALREKDAPNYRQIVLQPQDITSIRSAIKQGNKAAVSAANSLPGGDPGTANVWLPLSDDLIPPKGIINSAQLERELVHMFCNAIMYNPDPDRGPGSSFLKRSQEEEEEAFGYRLDENGIVRNTQSMFLEVEKLLGDLRSAEKDRIAPPLSTPRPTSVATPIEETGEEEEDVTVGEGDNGQGTAKRRRIRA